MFFKKIISRLGYEVYRCQPEAPIDLVQAVCEQCKLPQLQSIDLELYRKQLSPLFPQPTVVPADALPGPHKAVAAALNNDSINVYFSVAQDHSSFTITDDFPGSQYYRRQRMLYSAYRQFIGETLKGTSVLDIGCSSGYYSLFCSRLGASRVLGIDARTEHADQFHLLQQMLKFDDSIQYQHCDMEYGLENLKESFDLVLAQGVMYHVYDHPRFIRNLYRLTRKVLVLEGDCSGRLDRLCQAVMEDTGTMRASIHGPSLAPSIPWAVDLLRWVGFRNLTYVCLPSEVQDQWGFHRLYRAMIVAEK